MIGKKEIPLKIELFSDGEDSPFLIHSKPEIRFILHEIAQKGARTALYCGVGNDFILTTLLDASEQGVWLDFGPNAQDNRRALRSDKIIFVGSHQRVKVQFVAHRIEAALFNDREAFYLPLPDALLRLQRRDYYRLPAPARNPLKCVIPITPAAAVKSGAPPPKREAVIMDISAGGVALVCAEREAELQPGKIYPGCQIPLPEVGTLTATIRVKNVMEVTARGGAISKHAGCELLHLDGKMAILLQRYITKQQTSIPEQ